MLGMSDVGFNSARVLQKTEWAIGRKEKEHINQKTRGEASAMCGPFARNSPVVGIKDSTLRVETRLLGDADVARPATLE